MRTMNALFLVASLALLPALALAQGSTPQPAWKGKSVALVKVDGRSIAAACPELIQIDHLVRERAYKWDRDALGCRYMLSGNFSNANVVEEAGDYIRVKFALTSFSFERTFWTPRRNFRIVS
jgi:hypothetical protein